LKKLWQPSCICTLLEIYMPGLAISADNTASERRSVKYPGLRATVDGSEAVAWVEAHVVQAACAFPTPPASRMAERFAREIARTPTNLWNERIDYLVCESAHSAASACEGFALAGGRASSFASGTELVRMAAALYACAGKRLPLVFHAASRSLASHAVTIQPGHDDAMLLADCGWAILFARNAQEAADLAAIARRAAELAETPFLNFQDGHITTHTLETVALPEPELLKLFIGAPSRRLRNVFDPGQPLVSGPLENQDSYMRGRVAQRFFFERVAPSLATAMSDWFELTGRRYGMVRTYRMEDAQYAMVGLGSVMDAADAAVDQLRSKGVRAGSVAITAFRPFPRTELVNALARCRAAAVIERTDTPLAGANPLAREVKAALAAAQMGEDARLLRIPEIYSGAAGLGGRPVSVAALMSAVENMRSNGRRFFVLGVKHPDALTSLPEVDARPAGAWSLRVHGMSGQGCVTAAKVVAAVGADAFGLEVRASSQFSAGERGLPTTSFVTLAPQRIHMIGPPAVVDMVAIFNTGVFTMGDPLEGLRPGGSLLLNTEAAGESAWTALPAEVRRTVREREIRVYAFDAAGIARECAPSRELEQRMQGVALVGAFLKTADLPHRSEVGEQHLLKRLEAALERFFEHHGADLLEHDISAAKRAFEEVRRVSPAERALDYQAAPLRPKRLNGAYSFADPELVPAGFCDHVIASYVEGRDSILESDLYMARSIMPAGSARYRSFRHLSPEIPEFTAKNCTGCMECVNSCPDSALAARVVEPETLEHVPDDLRRHFAFTQKYYESFLRRGETGGLFGLYVDADRCKGCGECVAVCGGRDALKMVRKSGVDLAVYDRARDLFESLPETPERFMTDRSLGDLLLSGRARLYSGGASSCMGCGESTAIRLLLSATGFIYGRESIGIVAALGCHTAAGSTYPFNPYGVSWANTLADNAPADAMGIRLKWDQQGYGDRRLWIIGADDAIFGAGLQSLARMLDSGLDIQVLVLDKTQTSAIGDLGSMFLGRGNTLVAQTTAAHLNHFYKCIMAANEHRGPAVVICYSACTTEHGVPDDQANARARLAVDSRAFPLYIYDPRAGERIRERLDLRGNPALGEDWSCDSKTLEPVDFIAFARGERRFSAHFDAGGNPDDRLQELGRNALQNWRRLQELAGIR
jgi:pyruvate-ferredoxin/flavodoxin oxidoreductase